MSPDVGSSRPESTRSSVVLPAPLSPSISTTSPGCRTKSSGPKIGSSLRAYARRRASSRAGRSCWSIAGMSLSRLPSFQCCVCRAHGKYLDRRLERSRTRMTSGSAYAHSTSGRSPATARQSCAINPQCRGSVGAHDHDAVLIVQAHQLGDAAFANTAHQQIGLAPRFARNMADAFEKRKRMFAQVRAQRFEAVVRFLRAAANASADCTRSCRTRWRRAPIQRCERCRRELTDADRRDIAARQVRRRSAIRDTA